MLIIYRIITEFFTMNLFCLKNKIISNEGSIQEIDEIPEHIRKIYKTSWDMSPKVIIDQAADRGAFICQSQSMNLWLTDLNHDKMTSMYFYAWNKGLKTGQYYLRSRRAVNAKKITVAAENQRARGRVPVQPEQQQSTSPNSDDNIPMCRRDNPDCLACGS